MSVINKMLRDLDQRQAVTVASIATREQRTGIERDTLIVHDVDLAFTRSGRPRKAVTLGAVAVALVVIGFLGWYFWPRPVASPEQTISSPVASVDKRPVVREVAVAVVAAPASQPASALKATTAPVAALPVSVPVPLKNLVMQAPAAIKTPPAAPSGLPVPLAPVAHAPGLPTGAMSSSVPGQSAALEALAQARTMWNAGAREAAMDLLREAVAVSERSPAALATLGGEPVLASLVRELVRMELAEGRVSQALAMLIRLEPALSGVADVWALRGNAAQRLGRHQESSAAYLMALKLRPEEPRWLLGAAVSLAAQGQTDAASELAEKARTSGALSPEVATYLKQLGVRLRDR